MRTEKKMKKRRQIVIQRAKDIDVAQQRCVLQKCVQNAKKDGA